MKIDGCICQACGIEAPAKYVEFYQNIGALVVRFTSAVKGNLCKRCVHSHFWRRTLVTAGVGWFGTISLFAAPIFVVMNVVRYISAIGMPRVPPDARRPVLDQAAANAIAPFNGELVHRLNQKERLLDVATAIAGRTGVTPGQVVLYVSWLAKASRPAPVAKTYGFPVQPIPLATAVAPLPPPLPVAGVPVQSISSEALQSPAPRAQA